MILPPPVKLLPKNLDWTNAKRLLFMYLILLGYLAGGMNKLYYHWDNVFWLYMFNGLMVATDIVLTHYYLYKNRKL